MAFAVRLVVSFAAFCVALAPSLGVWFLLATLPVPARASGFVTEYVIESACFGDAGFGGCSYGNPQAPQGGWVGKSPDEVCSMVPVPGSGYQGGGWVYKGVNDGSHGCIWRSYGAGDTSCNSDCGAGAATWSAVTFCPSGATCAQPTSEPHSCPAPGVIIPHPDTEHVALPGGVPQPVCDNGCAEINNHTAGSGVDGYGYGDATSTGHACNSNLEAGGSGPADQGGGQLPGNTNLPPDDPPPPNNCTGATACAGTVGTTQVCVACGTPTDTSYQQSSGTNPDGSSNSTETTTSSRDNGDGTVTTITTTWHSDGTHSSTITTNPGGTGAANTGGGSSGGGGTGAGGGTCVGTNCGDGTDSFGGSCTGTFTCNGDAIQCAIAQEQHIRACEMYQPETQPGAWSHGAQTLATAKADGDVPAWSPAAPANAVVSNFDWSTTIDHSSTLGGSCPSDVVIADGLVLSLSQLCPHLQTLGTFIEAMTAIACAFILFKGTK